MKTIWIMSIGLLAGLAFAQPQEGRRGPGRGGFQGSIGFAALDTNGDGTLDAGEIDAAPKVLAKLDKNADGQLSADEIRPAFPAGRERGGPEGERGGNVIEETVKTLMAFDANGDGKLSKTELPERMRGMFDRADENKDGFLSVDEVRKLATAQAAPAGGPGGREGPEGRRGGGDAPGREMNFIRMDPVFAAIDTNGDGVLSADEIRNSSAAIRKLDIDGDGKLTREELMTAMRRRREAEGRDR